MAERIGNLLGRLQFSDDQLQATQKGLKDAGVAMPNFGNVGKELAKEINEEPEVEVETEEEREYSTLLIFCAVVYSMHPSSGPTSPGKRAFDYCDAASGAWLPHSKIPSYTTCSPASRRALRAQTASTL